MKKLAVLAVAGLVGLGLAVSSANAQQRPMGATGSSTSSSPAAAKPAAKAAPAKKAAAKKGGSESVKALQTALNKNGASLKVDGMMGKGTRDALKKYQSANGLKATGRVDAATKSKLGV
jgi:peptidoglycan hydrolase-like protein with peptidoglycan-binding domain